MGSWLRHNPTWKHFGGHLHESGLFYESEDGVCAFLTCKPYDVIGYVAYHDIQKLMMKEVKEITVFEEGEVLEVVTSDYERHFFRNVVCGRRRLSHKFVEIFFDKDSN